VVKRLREAGAVQVAKVSLGALALNDIWFGGQTMNLRLLEEGAPGSSAGPGAATAAGLVGFSIGSETGGSIVAPDPAHPLAKFSPPRRVAHGVTLLGRLFEEVTVGRAGIALERLFQVSGERPAGF
jgi:Asp-tRNA(Asn)/Glu-tRNA(Gln) amidotransferase A subunit family amidase